MTATSLETENLPAKPQRATALDALRGFAILTMVLSGTIRYKILPDWMYHAQLTSKNPGLTWVDVVLPLFLFAMGAAIPLALSRRLEKANNNPLPVVFYILKRGALLGAFAIFLHHLRPHVINPNDADVQKWWTALIGFVLLFLMFVRWPKFNNANSYKQAIAPVVTIAAWVTATLVISQIQYPKGIGFDLQRSDIILVLLTNMAVFGSLIWLITKNNWWLRLGILALFIAAKLSAGAEGWLADIWSKSPAPWIFQIDYLKYLAVVIPATIAGDLLLEWSRNPVQENQPVKSWPEITRFASALLLMLAICLVLLVGLQSRWVWQTTAATAALCASGWVLFNRPASATGRLLQSYYLWGIYWLGLGLLFEPFQGGIKKDPTTFSYCFVTAGMSFLLLIAFAIAIDVFRQQRWLQVLVDNGQNPMIAYVAFANLVWPILNLTGWEAWIIENTATPGRGFLKGLISTAVIAAIVSAFTRLKIFWKT